MRVRMLPRGALLLPLLLPGILFAQTAKCAPTNDSLRTLDSARVGAGVYWVSLVATDGPKTRSQMSGTLTLRPTSASDRSKRTGEGPARSERRAAMPLWGWFDGDLRLVGAPLPEVGDTTVPMPDSDDPIFPGVVVLVQNWQNPSLLRQDMLWISTGQNFRAERNWMMADGPGIVLAVRVLTTDGFSGAWGAAGLARVGGYFCARRSS